MNKEERREYNKQWRERNPDYYKQWYAENPDKVKEFNRKFKEKYPDYEKNRNKKPIRRAYKLAYNYYKKDEKYNRGECTLTAQWIVDNIFTKPCHYCGETDWTKLGCDRIDNSLPHTPDNVVPCCKPCNDKRGNKDYNNFKKS